MNETITETCNFNISHYQQCLESAQKLGYQFVTMSEYASQHDQLNNSPAKIIILRHDIDHNLALALNFAVIEHRLGIKATYFIRLHGKYSITSLDNYRVLVQLLQQGHEIGLHHDCDFAALVGENAHDFFIRDKTILESVINKKIAGVSSHEPGKSTFLVTDKDLPQLGLQYQAYSDIFCKEMKYISDSSSRWREGCMCNHLGKQAKLCILTHPIWWFDKSPLENY
ncbi:MAG: hypothetical protein Q8R37_00430 [Nanoarchaeota archaeon]|nr:hypothetical protein [Nanoarchaeota archaeon]